MLLALSVLMLASHVSSQFSSIYVPGNVDDTPGASLSSIGSGSYVIEGQTLVEDGDGNVALTQIDSNGETVFNCVIGDDAQSVFLYTYSIYMLREVTQGNMLSLTTVQRRPIHLHRASYLLRWSGSYSLWCSFSASYSCWRCSSYCCLVIWLVWLVEWKCSSCSYSYSIHKYSKTVSRNASTDYE